MTIATKIKDIPELSFYRSISSSESVGFVCFESQSMVWMNDAFAHLFGYSPEELLGNSGRILFPSSDGFAKYDSLVYEEIRKNGFFHGKYKLRTKEGLLQWFGLNISPMRDSQNMLAAVFFRIANPDTEEGAQEIPNQRLIRAAKAANLGLWEIVDLKRMLMLHDERWCSILGYSAAEIEERPELWKSLIHPNDVPLVEDALRRHIAGDTPYAQFEHRLRHKDGRYIWALSVGRAVSYDRYGYPLRITGILMDISSSKEIRSFSEDLLHSIEKILERRIAAGPAHPEPVAEEEQRQEDVNVPILTPRQKQIIGLVAQGLTSIEIGKKLSISSTTAAAHRRNVMRLCGVHSAAELVRFSIMHRII